MPGYKKSSGQTKSLGVVKELGKSRPSMVMSQRKGGSAMAGIKKHSERAVEREMSSRGRSLGAKDSAAVSRLFTKERSKKRSS